MPCLINPNTCLVQQSSCNNETSSDNESLSDSETEDNSINFIDADKIYKPKELNDLLLNKMRIIVRRSQDIKIVGEIIDFKRFKNNSGCAFYITMNEEKIMCKYWNNFKQLNLEVDDIKQYENTCCTVTGYIKAEYFNGHRFVVIIYSISLINNNTKLKELKKICENKGYFGNKKNIEWDKIKEIGIISKTNTQGYNDFRNQFKVPLNINLQEIALEGAKTSIECIQSIDKLKNTDLIIIIRGGGDTNEISNSFDTIKLFDAIKNSKIPIATAIGHEQDKDDKLLITNISDIDFATPTACAKILNKNLYEPLITIIENQIDENEEIFYETLEKEKTKLYRSLNCFLQDFLKSRFCGIIIEINDNDTNIIIKKKNKYYNNCLNFENEVTFSEQDILLKDNILNGLNDEDINEINKNFLKLNIDNHKLTSVIEDTIKKIKKNDKLEHTFEDKDANKIKKYYLKTISKTISLNNLINIKEILLWYKEKIEDSMYGEDVNDIKDIYNFIKN